MSAKYLLQRCIDDVRRLQAERPDYDSVQVLVVRTRTNNALAEIFGANSSAYQTRLFKTFINSDFDLAAEKKQEAFMASLPLIEERLIELSQELMAS